MSRQRLASKDSIDIVGGRDHAVGYFINIYDSRRKREEGKEVNCVLEFDQLFGIWPNSIIKISKEEIMQMSADELLEKAFEQRKLTPELYEDIS